MSTPTPRRIEWSGPEGFAIWADEDGVHLRAPGGHALEMPDVERLFTLWGEARAAWQSGSVPAPQPPTREERAAMSYPWREESEKRRAIRAIEREFDTTDPATPF